MSTRAALLAREVDFGTYRLPDLNTVERDAVYEEVQAAERRLVSPTGTLEEYGDGSAAVPDQVLAIQGLSKALLTAEHATIHYRLRKGSGTNRRPKDADQGTAGLGYTVYDRAGSSLLVALGRQTGDANHDRIHPFKNRMQRIIDIPRTAGHLSLHGMNFGRVASVDDARAFNVLIGIGDEPTEETEAFAEQALAIAAKYDLRAAINQPVVQYDPATGDPAFNEDGSVRTITLAARGSGTTRYHAQEVAKAGKKPFIAAQLELSPSIRLMPEEIDYYPGDDSQRTGVYLGYLFVKECKELIELA